jgi:hypothetical protein
MKTFLTFLIPIIILYLLLSIFEDLRGFTKTPLGKFFAILIIIYYTTIDKKLGGLACCLIILYYHSTLEKMLNIKQGIFEESFETKEKTPDDIEEDGLLEGIDIDDGVEDLGIDDPMVDLGLDDAMEDLDMDDDNDDINNIRSSNMQESFSNYNNIYKPNETFNETIKYDKNKKYIDEFREQNCKNETLFYKNMIVKDDMIEHIYSDIDFPNEKCNPCSKRCNFSIIESKLKQETKLLPINSKN